MSGLAQLPERVPSRLLRYTQEELDLIPGLAAGSRMTGTAFLHGKEAQLR